MDLSREREISLDLIGRTRRLRAILVQVRPHPAGPRSASSAARLGTSARLAIVIDAQLIGLISISRPAGSTSPLLAWCGGAPPSRARSRCLGAESAGSPSRIEDHVTSAADSGPSARCSSRRGRQAEPAAAHRQGRAAPDGRPPARRGVRDALGGASPGRSSRGPRHATRRSASPAVARRSSGAPERGSGGRLGLTASHSPDSRLRKFVRPSRCRPSRAPRASMSE